MAGILVNVLRRQVIQIPNVSGSSEFMWPLLAQTIDALGWVSGTLIVSVYAQAFTYTSGTPKLKFFVANTMLSPDDPSKLVIETGGDALAQVEVAPGTSTQPALYTAKIPTPTTGRPYPAIGRYLGVGMSLTAGGANSTGGDITVAIDLVGRDA
ncbi:MAG: hypothetical protein HYV09_29260 [Deltaproteobacteria bacterium]|nr:hypothetical protein [Deltaproteobacteria bacterium]